MNTHFNHFSTTLKKKRYKVLNNTINTLKSKKNNKISLS